VQKIPLYCRTITTERIQSTASKALNIRGEHPIHIGMKQHSYAAPLSLQRTWGNGFSSYLTCLHFRANKKAPDDYRSSPGERLTLPYQKF